MKATAEDRLNRNIQKLANGLDKLNPADEADRFLDSIASVVRTAERYINQDLDAKGIATLSKVCPRMLDDRALRPWRKWLSVSRLRYVVSTFARMGAFHNIVLRNGVGFTRRTLVLVKG